MGLRDTQNIFNLIGRLNYSKTKIDDELSDTSTNAVQNKVLTEALDDKLSKSQGGVINGNLSIYGICDFNARRLRNVAAPEGSTDAANKKYVDDVKTIANGKVDKGTETGSGKAITDSASATANSALAVGQNAAASGVRAIAIGHDSAATNSDTIALGNGARANATGAVQIGYGTNNEPNTMQIFGYQLLNSSGKIPAQRLNLSAYEEIANKVTSIDENSTDVQYPSAKSVVDFFNSVDKITPLTSGTYYLADLAVGCYYIDKNASVRAYVQNETDIYKRYIFDEGYLVIGTKSGSTQITFIYLGHYRLGSLGVSEPVTLLRGQYLTTTGYSFSFCQFVTNMVTTLDDSSTNATYPSSKAVVDYVKNQKQHNFSTTEKVIGTWIDGSTLYEKVIQFGTWNFQQGVTITDSDLVGATLISCTGTAISNAGLSWSLPMSGTIISGNLTHAGFQLIPTNGKISIMVSSATNPDLDVTSYAIIRYTKTS